MDIIDQNTPTEENNDSLQTTFHLPITYLDPSEIHLLNPAVSGDLELLNPSAYNKEDNARSMYHHLFQPKHTFAVDMMSAWNKQYTSNIQFLTDTKSVLEEMAVYTKNIAAVPYQVSCSKIKSIWQNVKEDPYFIEKYNYMDWSMLKHLNESTPFLQGLSVIHLMSPVISFILPIVFLIFPFILLKIQGVSISVSSYINTLKHIAKAHFIGKALTSFSSFSWDKLVYGVFLFGMYIFQIYQNAILCKRFYTNIQNINGELVELRNYIDYSVYSMDTILAITHNKHSYRPFNAEVELRRDSLCKLRAELGEIYDFEHNLAKFNDIGYMLKCYYRIHTEPEYEDCLRYSFGFEGYVNNLIGLHENLIAGRISYAKFENNKTCRFIKQYYPTLMDENPVCNTCDFQKNMIISAPNKSGKTTILKTTAINIIISQQVGCGFYQAATLTPYTHIHSYINIPDTSGRDSLFQAESRRCKDILDTIAQFNTDRHRHFCIFDELYSGTNPTEASKAGYAFLQYLHSFKNANYILTTHYVSICKKYKRSPHTQNYKMEVIIAADGQFEYTYKLKKGVSSIKGGLRVLKDLDYPDEIIQSIENPR